MLKVPPKKIRGVMEFHRQHHPFNCFYCGVSLSSTPGECSITIDHVVARSNSGGNGDSNKVTACQGCNRAKGSLDIFDFIRQTGIWWAAEMMIRSMEKAKTLKPISRSAKCWLDRREETVRTNDAA